MHSVTFQLRGDRLTAFLSGEIDHHHAAAMREAIDQQVTQCQPTELVLDFEAVTFMDSSGIGLILGRYRWMRSHGGVVHITHITRQTEQLLLLSGIHKLVRMDPAMPDQPETYHYPKERNIHAK